jgi:hypothetical protein
MQVQAKKNKTKDFLSSTLTKAIHGTKHTVLFTDSWQCPSPLQRIWCVHELKETVLAGGKLTLALPAGQQQDMLHALSTDMDKVLSPMSDIDARTAKAANPADEREIKAAIEAGVGFERTNQIVTAGMLRWLVDMAKQSAEEQPPEESDRYMMLSQVGALLITMGEYEEAEVVLASTVQECMRALDREEASSNSAPHLCPGYDRLTLQLISHQEWILAWRRTALRCRCDYANLLLYMGKFGAAEDILQRDVTVCNELHGSKHPTTLTTLSCLAGALADGGKLDDALALREKVLMMAKVACEEGLYEPQSAASVVQAEQALVWSLQSVGRSGEAISLVEQVIVRQKAALGLRHPDVILGMGNLAAKMRSEKRTKMRNAGVKCGFL